MIGTVSESQSEILRNIATLHNGGRAFQADLTYSKGGFWRGMDYKPEIRADLDPDLPDLTHLGCDVRLLPFTTRSLESVVFDPPFIHAPGKDSIIGNRFSGFKSQRALMELYQNAAEEIHRVLVPRGLLVWKCQDIVESGKQVWNHIRIIDWCTGTTIEVTAGGFHLEDLFILVAKNRIQGHNHARQVHARKLHSYFLVFRKG